MAVGPPAVFPDDDFVEFDVGDGAGCGFGELVEVFEHEKLEGLLRSSAGFDDGFETFALFGEDFVLAAGFGFELGEDCGGFAGGFDAAFFGGGFGFNDGLGFLGFGGCFDGGAAFGFDFLGIGDGGFGLGEVLGFLHGGFGFAFFGFTDAVGLGLGDLQGGFGLSDFGLGCGFACDGGGVGVGDVHAHGLLGIFDFGIADEDGGLLGDFSVAVEFGEADGLITGGGLFADLLFFVEVGDFDGLGALRIAHADFAELLCVGDFDGAFALGTCDADGSELFLLGDVDEGLLNGLRGGFFADGGDVAGFVGDVGDVDVDEDHADFAEFGFERVLDVGEELFAVAVDLIDGHGGDDLAELAEDHVFGLGLEVVG